MTASLHKHLPSFISKTSKVSTSLRRFQSSLSTLRTLSYNKSFDHVMIAVTARHFSSATVLRNDDESDPELPQEVQSYLEKNSPITLKQGEVIQKQLLSLLQSNDQVANLASMPHSSEKELHEKWFKAMTLLHEIRQQLLKDYSKEFDSTDSRENEERLKTWLGRLSNHSEKIREMQTEMTSFVAEKLFSISDYEPLITDSRTIGIFYQADRAVQESVLQSDQFASKTLQEFAQGQIYDEQFQREVIFPQLYQEEIKLLKQEQEEQNEYRADIRKKVEEARKEFEENNQEFNLIEGADKIQQELKDMDTPEGWIRYKIQLGQCFYRFG